MRTMLIASLAAMLGCGVASLLPPSDGVRASTAAPSLCGCQERYMPTYASWRESHRMWSCTVALPKVDAPTETACTGWGLDQVPVGFRVVTP